MIYLVGAISAVFAFWVVVLARLLIRYAFNRARGLPVPLSAPAFRPDRIALAVSAGILVVLLAAFAIALP
jgi:hypothetical protein